MKIEILYISSINESVFNVGFSGENGVNEIEKAVATISRSVTVSPLENSGTVQVVRISGSPLTRLALTRCLNKAEIRLPKISIKVIKEKPGLMVETIRDSVTLVLLDVAKLGHDNYLVFSCESGYCARGAVLDKEDKTKPRKCPTIETNTCDRQKLISSFNSLNCHENETEAAVCWLDSVHENGSPS